MQTPPQITFRNMTSSPALEGQIRHRIGRLEHYFDRLISCRVMVEARHRQHRQGHLYHIRFDLGVTGAEIVVDRDPAEHLAHEDAHVAVRDAFDAASRQLDGHARRFRGETKAHEEPTAGQRA